MMKKGLLFILIVSVLLMFSGCLRKEYRFLQDTVNISSIQIVEIGKMDIGDEAEQKTICVIEDIKAFLKDFLGVDCLQRFSDPTCIADNATVIKIIYIDGEYELINHHGQSEFRDGYFYQYAGHYTFDEEQFDSLIIKYTNTDITTTS